MSISFIIERRYCKCCHPCYLSIHPATTFKQSRKTKMTISIKAKLNKSDKYKANKTGQYFEILAKKY